MSNHIEVNVKSLFLEKQSIPSQNYYVFSYTVTLRNTGEITAKLLSRHWIVTNADGEKEEIQGAGVVGEYPQLEPGEVFQYTSGVVLSTPVGSMQGSYHMISERGEQFYAHIPPFRLATPNLVN